MMSLARLRLLLWVVVGIVAASIVVLLWRQSSPQQVASSPLGTIGGPFTLTGTDGQPFASSRLNGRPAALFFGFTHCPDVCPTTLARLTRLRQQLGKGDDALSIVFVSVDPDRDTPEILHNYVKSFHPSFVGLTGTPEELKAAQEAANVPVATFDGDQPDYAVNHAAWVIAYGRDGLNHSIYPSGVRQSQWNNDLRVLAEMG